FIFMTKIASVVFRDDGTDLTSNGHWRISLRIFFAEANALFRVPRSGFRVPGSSFEFRVRVPLTRPSGTLSPSGGEGRVRGNLEPGTLNSEPSLRQGRDQMPQFLVGQLRVAQGLGDLPSNGLTKMFAQAVNPHFHRAFAQPQPAGGVSLRQ